VAVPCDGLAAMPQAQGPEAGHRAGMANRGWAAYRDLIRFSERQQPQAAPPPPPWAPGIARPCQAAPVITLHPARLWTC
jgi:hypothetical protein